jgi:hypothetical protein
LVKGVFQINKNFIATWDFFKEKRKKCGFPYPAHTSEDNNFPGAYMLFQYLQKLSWIMHRFSLMILIKMSRDSLQYLKTRFICQRENP